MSIKTCVKVLCLSVFFFSLNCGILHAKDDPYKQMAKELSDSASRLTNPKIAVIPFSYVDKRKSNGGAIICERLTTRLVKIGKYKVIERQLLENVLQELHLESTGVVDVETTKQLGKVLGVEAIITGSLMDSGEDKVEANARVIKTDTAEVIATASMETTKDWTDEIPGQQQPAQTAYQYQPEQPAAKYERVESPMKPAAPLTARQYKRPTTYLDFLVGGGSAMMDLTLKNSSRLFRESELLIDINGDRILDNVGMYRSVKFNGAELKSNSMPMGLRMAAFGEHWGGAVEVSYYSYTIAKQKTTFSYNGGASRPFEFFVDDYLRVNVLNLFSGDLMFRFSKNMFQPYVGLGIGMSFNFISSPYMWGYNDGVYSPSLNEMSVGFLFRVPMGLRVAFSDNGSAFIEYRPTTNYTTFDRGVTDETDEVSMDFNFLMFGLGYKF